MKPENIYLVRMTMRKDGKTPRARGRYVWHDGITWDWYSCSAAMAIYFAIESGQDVENKKSMTWRAKQATAVLGCKCEVRAIELTERKA